MEDHNVTHLTDQILSFMQGIFHDHALELRESLDSRQARRERIMCALLSSGLEDTTFEGYNPKLLIEKAEEILDASDALDKEP